MNFSEFYKPNPLTCLILFVLIQHILVMVQIRSHSNSKIIFFLIYISFFRSLSFFFPEKLLLQCHTFDSLFNWLIEHGQANKSGAAGIDRLPFVPGTAYSSAESLKTFIVSCYLSLFVL